MPWTDEELDELEEAFDTLLPTALKSKFNASSTKDTAEAVTKVIGRRRTAGITIVLNSLVTVQIANWAAAKQAAVNADGATHRPALEAFWAAFQAESPTQGPLAYAALFAALKHHQINTP
jgi:hypothetical protein